MLNRSSPRSKTSLVSLKGKASSPFGIGTGVGEEVAPPANSSAAVTVCTCCALPASAGGPAGLAASEPRAITPVGYWRIPPSRYGLYFGLLCISCRQPLKQKAASTKTITPTERPLPTVFCLLSSVFLFFDITDPLCAEAGQKCFGA